MIDINGSKLMSWEDFTSFLVDQGMTKDVAKEFNIIRFSPSTVIRDDIIHQSHLEKACYFKNYDKIAFIEQGSKVLKICTPELVLFKELRDFSQVPLCMEYIDSYKFVVVACSDLSLTFYATDNGLKLVKRVETKTAQLVMCWSEVGQVLFSADHEGRIFAWDIGLVKASAGRSVESTQGDPWREFLKKPIAQQDPPMRHIDNDTSYSMGDATPASQRAGNTSATRGRAKTADTARYANSGNTIVTMLLELQVLAQMASSGVDRNIMIWDVYTGSLKRTLRGHEMGIRAMAFAPSLKVLVTGGFDYKLQVWNPYVGKSIHTITAHAAPIVGIETLGAASNQAISADEDGIMKTWDLSAYQCLQTIVVDQLMTLRAFVSVPLHRRVFVVDRDFMAYDYQNTGPGESDQTDDQPIFKALYFSRVQIFVTGCATHIRIWDAITGAIKCIVPHTESEITDFCVDDRGRKLFIADHNGDTFVHNVSTGCFIKKLTKHSKEVAGLIYCDGDTNVISVSWDRSLIVHDESERTPNFWRKATNMHDGDVTCVAFSRHLGLIATGATDCVISLREYERVRTVSSLVGHKSDITALAFVEPLALLASADLGGFVAIWSVPAPAGKQHKHVNEVLTRFINMQSLESCAAVNCFFPVYEQGDNRFVLYAGDEDGDVRAWDLTQLLVEGDVAPCEAKADWDPRKKVGEIDCGHTAMTMARRAVAPETPELPVHVDAPVMRQVLSWKAHSDSVRSIRVYSKPDFVLTAGYDKLVKLWSREGETIAMLTVYGSHGWNFKVDETGGAVDEEDFRSVMDKVKKIEKEIVPLKPRMTKVSVDLKRKLEHKKPGPDMMGMQVL
eukprot:TRINITY_DN21784_c0_g2_i1.p1 TRINITY_DN21784_c0_g2~~TRINITY_DN21784_c0_g2_i1.p1  ORF type:complete len:941 (-),score=156.39 TRINITY_DN21784_c0_g2_i1:90-2621(-)